MMMVEVKGRREKGRGGGGGKTSPRWLQHTGGTFGLVARRQIGCHQEVGSVEK